jgi:hypothetical protein
MGIDKELLTAAIAVPHESARFLERDELVHFGIDRREFGETAWRFRSGGGSWNFSPSYLRAAHRLMGTPDNRVFGNAVGFRVGRTLTP